MFKKPFTSLTSLLSVTAAILLIIFLWWKSFGQWYLNLPEAIGGDYYVGLTYADHLAHHLPLPPSGWLPFSNSGTPLIGGYQWLPFYLMAPLFAFNDAAKAMDIFSAGSILFFLLFSHLVYLQISKNQLASLGLTLVTLTSQAVYFQLASGGFITGSSVQMYLPMALFFLLRFIESPKRLRSFFVSALLTGLAIIHHSAMGLLFVATPIIVIFLAALFMMVHRTLKFKFVALFQFIFLTVLVSAVGLFPFIFQMSFSTIASPCDNSQCWGIYPEHIFLWFGIVPSIICLLGILIAGYVSSAKRNKPVFKEFIVLMSGFISVLWYPIFAYLHLINTLANSIFPRRMFWALLFMILAAGALVFRIFPNYKRLGQPFIGGIFLLSIFVFLFFTIKFPLTLDLQLPQTPPNVDPVIDYKQVMNGDRSKLFSVVPSWLTVENSSYRLDTQNSLVSQWWNLTSTIPITRGYTSSFNKAQSDWVYYLQVALSQSGSTGNLRNRANFLWDAYGIGFATPEYDSQLQSDTELITKRTERFLQINSQYTSPIISGTSSPRVLFIGSENGYSVFIKNLANLGYTSQKFIPIQGPTNLSAFPKSQLSQFSLVYLYQYQGNLSNLSPYIENGGTVFIESGGLPEALKKTDDIYPFTQVDQSNETAWNITQTLKDSTIDAARFSPLSNEHASWKILSVRPENLKKDSQVLLAQNGNAVLIEEKKGSGKIVWSGLNLPFHLELYHNNEEYKLIKQIFENFNDIHSIEQVSVIRPNPESITISSQQSNGIYVKENFHSGWRASISNKKAPVFRAGLNFMYIPITPGDILNLDFTGSFTDWFCFSLTVIGVFLSLALIISPHFLIRLFSVVGSYFHRIMLKPNTLATTDEHEQY